MKNINSFLVSEKTIVSFHKKNTRFLKIKLFWTVNFLKKIQIWPDLPNLFRNGAQNSLKNQKNKIISFFKNLFHVKKDSIFVIKPKSFH